MTPLSYTESQFAVLSLQILSVNNINFENIDHAEVGLSEAQHEKTGLRGFRPGATQTGLCSLRRWLEL